MKKKILLAEHNPDDTEFLINVLNIEDTKNEVVFMKDGQEVIDYFQKSNIGGKDRWIQIDLIILDHNLPEVNGMDVLRFLKKNSSYCSIPIIIYSVRTDYGIAYEAYKNGANSFMVRPASLKEYVENRRLLEEVLIE